MNETDRFNNLHHIQKSIILSLSQKSPQRFKQLQPPRLPNNTFAYHIKKLVDSGYIKQENEGYAACRKALKQVSYGYDGIKNFARPITISMVYVTNTQGEVLLLNRRSKPFRGWYGLISGVIHSGETTGEAAARELLEKAKLKVEEKALTAHGVLEFSYRQNNSEDIFIHAIAFVFSYQYDGLREKLVDETTRFGQLSWSKFGRKNILPEVLAVQEMVTGEGYQHQVKGFTEPEIVPILSGDTVAPKPQKALRV